MPSIMIQEKIILSNTEDDIRRQLTTDLAAFPGIQQYQAIIKQNGKPVHLFIDIDPGGGFESGYEATLLRATADQRTDFSFVIHKEAFFDKVGKLFGMQDVEVGYPEFDKQAIIKTNDEERIKNILADPAIRKIFQWLAGFNFQVRFHRAPESDNPESFLELEVEAGVTDVEMLLSLYKAFTAILAKIH